MERRRPGRAGSPSPVRAPGHRPSRSISRRAPPVWRPGPETLPPTLATTADRTVRQPGTGTGRPRQQGMRPMRPRPPILGRMARRRARPARRTCPTTGRMHILETRHRMAHRTVWTRAGTLTPDPPLRSTRGTTPIPAPISQTGKRTSPQTPGTPLPPGRPGAGRDRHHRRRTRGRSSAVARPPDTRSGLAPHPRRRHPLTGSRWHPPTREWTVRAPDRQGVAAGRDSAYPDIRASASGSQPCRCRGSPFSPRI